MTFLVTFADGHSTLVASREAAEQIAAYWPQLHATIRDLDQEARDREEMLARLEQVYNHCDEMDLATTAEWWESVEALLKRLGRLP